MFSQAYAILFTSPPLVDTPWANTPRADTPLVRHPSRADTPRQTPAPGRHPPAASRHPPGQTFPGQTPPQIATAADGTHPTGMHSCLYWRIEFWCKSPAGPNKRTEINN